MIDDVDVSSSTLRLLASQTLKAWSNDGAFKLLSDEDYVVRTLAARELHTRCGKEIFDKLVTLASSGSDFMREICAFALGQFGTPKMPYKNETIPVLLNLITDVSAEVRAASAAALGHICFDGMPREVENALYVAVSDADKDVRCCVASSLGNASKRQETIDALNKLLQDPEKEVQEYAELGKDILTG